MNETNLRLILANDEVRHLTVARLKSILPGATVSSSQYDPGMSVRVRLPGGETISALADYSETYTAAALAFALLMERGLLSETIIESVINPSMNEGDINA